MLRSILLGLLAFIIPTLAPAATEARLVSLSEDRFWLLLAHYERTRWGNWRSHVDDERFFLSSEGPTEPLAELQATLTALYAPASLGDQHARCRYPARSRWLEHQLGLQDLPVPQCSEFEAWFREINPHRTVMIFPAAYLNSPSSIFGHTLLRVDPPESVAQGTTLLSHALNFGAMIEGSDNSMLYAWKGLMGGYPGQFAILPYHEKLAEYSRLENRDLWEYYLDLTPEESARMVEHLWELRQVRFDYFFFDENCSYRVLELLEVARPSLRLTHDFSLTAIPADTVKAVETAGIIKRRLYRPSRERELQAREARLTPAERDWAKALALGERSLQDREFLQLPAGRRAEIQDAAYRLVRYQAAGKDREASIAQRSYGLLRGIQANPAPELQIGQPDLPEHGHDSRTLGLELGQREARSYADYSLRMAYHDLNDNLSGFPFGAQIEIARLAFRQYESGYWQLQQLELAGIRSLTTRSTLLKPLSWQVRGGLERVLSRNEGEKLVSHISGGAGLSQDWGESVRSFAMATARLEHNGDFSTLLAPAVGFNTGLLWRNDLGQLLLEGRGDYFRNGEARRQMQLVQQWEVAPALGLRLSARRDWSQRFEPVTEVGLSVRWYLY